MISVLIPTRKRPDGLRQTLRSIAETKSSPIEVICYLDNDDESYDGGAWSDFDVTWITGPRIILSNMWNKCAEKAKGDLLMQGNDDIIYRTPGWDRMVEDIFAKSEDKILVVHGADGSADRLSATGGFGPHPVVHRRWVETLGYFTPPYFSCDYGDTWIHDLAESVGRRRYLPFIVEHMHPFFGKGQQDQTYHDRINRGSVDNVARIYDDLYPLRQIDIEKLRAVMK